MMVRWKIGASILLMGCNTHISEEQTNIIESLKMLVCFIKSISNS
jgi:hypothetical protein